MIATVDIIFLIIMLLSALVGLIRGFVFELASLTSWIAALVVAFLFAPTASHWLPDQWSGAVKYGVACIIIFIACVFLFSGLAVLLRKLIGKAGLAPADRALGGLFGLLRGLIILLMLTECASITQLGQSAWWQQGVSPRWTASFLTFVHPYFVSVQQSMASQVD